MTQLPGQFGVAPKRWSFLLPRLEDELLSSWLTRAAHAHGTGPHSFCAQIYPHAQIWTRDIDRSVSDELIGQIAASVKADPAAIVGASLRPIAERLAGRVPAPTSSDVPFLLRVGVLHRTRTLHGLQYCPACLAAPPTFYRRAWRIGFVTACANHAILLHDGCPRCDAPVVPQRAPIGKIGRCHICKYELAGAPHIPADSSLLAFQNALMGYLLEGRDGIVSWDVDPFCALRTLVAVATPRPVLNALCERFQIERPADTEQRLVFEHVRGSMRRALLSIVNAWTASWPDRFIAVAQDAGLTRRSFQRRSMPPALAAAVAELLAGQTRRRPPWASILNDRLMRRLRRRDKTAWRTLHARRALAGRAIPPDSP